MGNNTLQSLDAIQPITQDGEKSSDPVDKEYQEGKKFLEDGDLSQAAVALHNALVGYEQKDNSVGVANASNQLGHVCLQKDDYANALKHYLRAYEICDELNDRMSVLAVAHKIVDVYFGLEDYKNAVKWCLEIIDLYHDNRNPQGMVLIMEKLATIYIEAGDTELAADTYRTIASIHKNFKHEKMAQNFLEKAAAVENKE